jgi:hypothetical protein
VKDAIRIFLHVELSLYIGVFDSFVKTTVLNESNLFKFWLILLNDCKFLFSSDCLCWSSLCNETLCVKLESDLESQIGIQINSKFFDHEIVADNEIITCSVNASCTLVQGCHNGRFWMKITVRTSFSSGRPPAAAFTPRTGFYRPRSQKKKKKKKKKFFFFGCC